MNDPIALKRLKEESRQNYIRSWRDNLIKVRIFDPKMQEAIIKLAQEQAESTDQARIDAGVLEYSIASNKISDADIEAKLVQIQAAVAAAREQRAQALKEFSTRFDMEHNPHLESELMNFGLLGDEAATVDSVPTALLVSGLKGVRDSIRVLVPDDAFVEQAVTQYVADQEKRLLPILVYGYQDQRNVFLYGAPIMEDRRTFLTNYREEVAFFKVRRDKDLAALDAKIAFSQTPRLKAALYLLGISSDDLGIFADLHTTSTTGFKRLFDVVSGKIIPSPVSAPIPKR